MVQETYFVYCINCEKRVKDSTQICPSCKSAEGMVDWPEPVEDCTQIENRQDCIERDDPNPCATCIDWCVYEKIRTAE